MPYTARAEAEKGASKADQERRWNEYQAESHEGTRMQSSTRKNDDETESEDDIDDEEIDSRSDETTRKNSETEHVLKMANGSEADEKLIARINAMSPASKIQMIDTHIEMIMQQGMTRKDQRRGTCRRHIRRGRNTCHACGTWLDMRAYRGR